MRLLGEKLQIEPWDTNNTGQVRRGSGASRRAEREYAEWQEDIQDSVNRNWKKKVSKEGE